MLVLCVWCCQLICVCSSSHLSYLSYLLAYQYQTWARLTVSYLLSSLGRSYSQALHVYYSWNACFDHTYPHVLVLLIHSTKTLITHTHTPPLTHPYNHIPCRLIQPPTDINISQLASTSWKVVFNASWESKANRTILASYWEVYMLIWYKVLPGWQFQYRIYDDWQFSVIQTIIHLMNISILLT